VVLLHERDGLGIAEVVFEARGADEVGEQQREQRGAVLALKSFDLGAMFQGSLEVHSAHQHSREQTKEKTKFGNHALKGASHFLNQFPSVAPKAPKYISPASESASAALGLRIKTRRALKGRE
jgi:hypothetical protein